MVVDGLCPVAGEDLRMSERGIHVALTASHKVMGMPPGLALMMASPRGTQIFRVRKSPVINYDADNSMTAPRFPPQINGPDFLAKVSRMGVTLAGGLHPAIRTEHFRIGHLGAVSLGDVLTTVGAIELALEECGYVFELGRGAEAAVTSAG
jgi:aspartate aminotransferase-like enzyme